MATLSERIKSIRKGAGLTQQEFGEIFGVAKNTVCQYESGRSAPNDDLKIAMANHFNVSMDYLMGKTDNTGFDSKTPPVIATQITNDGIDAIHAYLELSPQNKKKVEDYIQILSQWEKAYLDKKKHRKKQIKEENT